MASRVRTRAGAIAVIGATVLVGVAACGASGGGGTASGSTTSTPVSTSFRTIPVTSTTTIAPPAAAQDSTAADDGGGGYNGDTYTVRAGDAWPLIAKRVGVPLDRLLAFNGALPTTPLYTGHTVRVPPPEGTTGSTGGSSGSGTTITAPDGYILHTVVVGDTWIGIAKKYGADWKAVMQANGVTPDLNSKAPLTVGGQIKVPKKA
jgi:LysM repeat protein